MQHFKTITEYYKAIGLDAPRHPHFDIKSFEENMGKVASVMTPFRHELYFIGIKVDGGGKVLLGHNTTFPKGITVFFNSPFQIQSWDTMPDWSGYYILISKDFIASSHLFDRLLDDYPFLKIEESIPFEINKADVPEILFIYERIKEEYLGGNEDKFSFIEVYILQLLNQLRRLFLKNIDKQTLNEQIHSANTKILSDFQELIKTSFYPDTKIAASSNIHSPSYYADILHIHPNHLNAVVKSITGITALRLIHNHILELAKAELVQTNVNVKEIAYNLHFDSPSNFGAFFKKNTGLTPVSYRKNA
ncbi:helix-turn-helix domain-containing protein [Carboxylicivirga sp. RSCT41]|uniref:helix-turn-helix domain-containing protein n=1 Tax=Carboxylicivirga agarovorans TaxID=3417570 RepID=UPI003D3266DF